MKTNYYSCLTIVIMTGSLLLFSSPIRAQMTYKKVRSNFSIIPRFGIPIDNNTKDNFRNFASIGLRKEFPLGKFVSLNAVGDYDNYTGKNLPNSQILNLGGGVTLYPYYLIYLIFGKTYDDETAKKDKFYFDEDISLNLNNNYYGSGGNVATVKFEFNLNQYRLSNKLALSPKVGYIIPGFSQDIIKKDNVPGFLYLGLALDLGSFPKAK